MTGSAESRLYHIGPLSLHFAEYLVPDSSGPCARPCVRVLRCHLDNLLCLPCFLVSPFQTIPFLERFEPNGLTTEGEKGLSDFAATVMGWEL